MLDYNGCEKEFAKARTSVIFKVKCKKLANNTYLFKHDDRYSIRYHQTDIVSVDKNNTYYICNGDWWTRSTLERINRYAPVTFRQREYNWYYNDKHFRGYCIIVPEEFEHD
jgi:hypothetical protein